MKKYFAKYLPLKNKIIQDGDLIMHPTTGNRMIATKDMGLGYLTVNTDWVAIKLFLCSRDIQVGDKVKTCQTKDDYYRDNPILTSYPAEGIVVSEDTKYVWNIKYTTNEGEYVLPIPKNYCIKVIGEVSPDATWVKEGDEFDEDEVELWARPISNHYTPYRPLKKEHWFDGTKRESFWKIKGPCGHFH